MTVAAAGLCLALLAGCGRNDGSAASSGTPGASGASGVAVGNPATAAASAASAPPVTVTTVKAQQRDLPVLLTATGSVAPLSSVEVRPQVTSAVTQVHIREGDFVRKGQLMFTLDSRTDEANVAKALAQLARDEAALADAQRQFKRSRELLAQNFISQGALDTAQTLVQTQQAAVAADKAAIDAARVPLSYARITAPGAGRVGAIAIYPGTSVQANQTLLVTIVQLDPIAVSFSLPQRNLGDALGALKGGGAAVAATLPDSGATLKGRLQFVDNSVDPATGSVRVKAIFDNPQGRLWPGAFVNVEMTAQTLKGAVVVPQATIIQSARGPMVYAVQGNRALPRPVQLLYAQGEDAAVSGVTAGERIVLDGRQNLRPGALVVERPLEAAGRAGSAARAASGASAATGGAGAGSQAAAGGTGRPPAP